MPHLGQKPSGPAGATVARAAHGRAADRTVALVLRHLGVDHDRVLGVDHRGGRHPGETGAQPRRPQSHGAGVHPLGDGRAAAEALRSERGGAEPAGPAGDGGQRGVGAGGRARPAPAALEGGGPRPAPRRRVTRRRRSSRRRWCRCSPAGCSGSDRGAEPVTALLARDGGGAGARRSTGPGTAADVAVAVDDGAGAARLGTPSRAPPPTSGETVRR